jgi:hypothetical protein
LLAAPSNGSPDLDDVTFERTTLHGQRIPASVRSSIRNAAAEHTALAVKFEPLKPSAGVGAFRKVIPEEKSPSELTLKELQR